MRVLAADGKHGNRIVTLLAPDHAHDGGESLIALASTSKTLYQNEDMQQALGNVRMFREIASHLKDHMTNMSRTISIIYVVGPYWDWPIRIAWAVEGNDAWDPWDIKPHKMKPDHTPPEHAVLKRVAKSIANMK
jgi:hypothetical protein